jgi:hypothetical protein
VCPFLPGDTLAARCDLKADRAGKILMAQSAFLEPGQDARRVAPELAAELRSMQKLLELERIYMSERGDLASMLRKGLTGRRAQDASPGALAARGATPVGRVASAAREPARSSDAGDARHSRGDETKPEPGAVATLWAGRMDHGRKRTGQSYPG